MASLNDLYDAYQNKTFEGLRRKIEMALLIKAQVTIAAGTPAERVAWAKGALNDIENESRRLLNYVIGLNNGQTVPNIASDADATVKTTVNTAIDLLYPA